MAKPCACKMGGKKTSSTLKFSLVQVGGLIQLGLFGWRTCDAMPCHATVCQGCTTAQWGLSSPLQGSVACTERAPITSH